MRSSGSAARVAPVKALRVSLSSVALLLVAAAPALAYPRVLFDAVTKAYAPKKPHIEALCHEKIGKSTYTRVDLTLGASDKTRQVAFQWTNGWRPLWKDGALVRTIPKHQRAHFRWIMRELNRFCDS